MTRRAYTNLAHYFEQSGDTQEQLAERLGLSQSQISRYKNGLQQPTLAIALRLAHEANIPLESLITVAGPASDVAEDCNE